MADISIIHSGSTDYKVKDAAGRLALAEVENKGAKNDFGIENLIKSAISENVTYSLSGYSLTASSNGRYARVSIPYKFKAGTTVFSSVVSEYSKSGGTMYIRFATQSSSVGQITSEIEITGNGQYQREITVNADTDGFVIYYMNGSPDTYVNSAVFTNNMICTKAEWDISQAYVPYGKTNAELTSDVSALFTENTRQETEIGLVANAGAKNFAVPFDSISTTDIIVTRNANGSYTFACTNVSENRIIRVANIGNLPSGSYTFSGATGGSSSTYMLGLYNTSASAVKYQHTNAEETYTGNVSGFSLRVRVISGYSGTFTVYPMIRPASITDSTFVPYAPTNRELYEEKIDHDLPVVSGSILDYADTLAPGIYFARQDSSTGSGKPVNNRLYVYNIYVYSSATATIMAIEGEDSSNPRMYLTNKVSGTWGSWYKFEGTEVT